MLNFHQPFLLIFINIVNRNVRIAPRLKRLSCSADVIESMWAEPSYTDQ